LATVAFILFFGAMTGSAWCRTDPAVQSSWFVNMKAFSVSAHTGLACQECHGSMTEHGGPHPNPADPTLLKMDIKKAYDYGLCARCHKKAYERYQQGEHGKKRKAELTGVDTAPPDRVAPACGHCHSAHYQKSHLSRVETGRNMVETCGACHGDQKKSYLENFHGKTAVNLGNDRAAYCTDCHGAHRCNSLNEDKKATLAACLRCHPDAEQAFADIVIHNSTKDLDKKAGEKKAFISHIHMAGTLSFSFVAIVLVCFYSHSFLLMLRKIHHKLRKHE